MQNIRIIDTLDFAKDIKTQEYNNPSYAGIIHNSFKRFLTSDEINIVELGFRRSIWSEEAFYRNFNKTDVPEHTVLKDEHYYKALTVTSELFRPKEILKPVHYADLRLYPWRLSTNIGAPYNISQHWIDLVKDKFKAGYITDARLSKHNLYNEFFVNNRYLYHLIKDGKTTDDYGNDLKYWNTAFARLHLVESQEPDKVRLVFGAPTLLIQSEMAFIWPFQISLLSRGMESPMLWGFETLTGGWYKLRNWFSSQHPGLNTFFTFDWSSFDLTARHSVITDIHKSWKTYFTFNDGYWPTVDYPVTTPEPERLNNLWNWMTNSVLKTPLLLPNGNLVEFLHSGIFSGYLQTQLLDSCYNTVMLLTILSRMGFDINKTVLKVQGDDSVGGLPSIIPEFAFKAFIEQVKLHAQIYFGAQLNDKKSSLHRTLENVEVLKYYNHGGIPYRDEFSLLAMLKHPERSQSLPVLMARAIGIAYANCGAHSRVYQICEDIYYYLKGIGITPNPQGLPGVLSHLEITDTGELPFTMDRFPTFFDTIRLSTETTARNVSLRNWNTQHFVGTPT